MQIRAYSQLDVTRAVEENGKRMFTGIANTPSTDRMGDIVEPAGAEFKLPLPLLWQHDSRQPIGWVRSAKVSDDKITVDCEMAMVPDDGPLKLRLDEAWQMLRAKLVAGLSIGFNPIEYTRISDTYSYRYVKWQWLELSAVTIPANGDCSITAIKSADTLLMRAARAQPRVVRLETAPAASGISDPGASGAATTRRKGVVYL